MRETMLLLVVLSSCAARQTPADSAATRYTCSDIEIVRKGDVVHPTVSTTRAPLPSTPLSWSDQEGDHFVRMPTSITDVDLVEYVVPTDPRADAIERRYDASKGRSTADWRLTGQRACRPHGGYSDVFNRWAAGASFDDITTTLSLESRAEARALVHHTLASLNKRYYGGR